MANTLTYISTTVTLPDDAIWLDEFAWPPVVQRTEYSVTGALLVDAAAKAAGQPMTIDCRWVAYSLLQTLQTWRALPGQTFTLFFRGVSHTVIFDHQAGAIEATPVVDYAVPAAADLWAMTLRFLKV